ncbi:vanin-like protein 2 isoform X2 [Anticarsia gemmatalis]|uniref:vanin-like protein 2 isoform X2 n=1 Tax=Anticarsia gemmatalis TaxID=129554 RepID=UPI003F776359
MLFPVLIFLSLVLSSFERSTPQDDHYVAAVVEYIVNRNVESNKANYEAAIKEAADQNADIVVFPELTLTNGTTSFAVPIFGLLTQYPIPALRPDLYDDLLVSMSAAARQNSVYLVINVRESVDCTVPQQGEECPEAKVYVFNTNVVFDRNGSVIDRYRKINLFGEFTHTPALKPDLGVFSTDFGVTFGHFICFDLMFQVPAIQVAQKHNLKDVIFTTMWFSEMPYLTAVQIQEAYAYTMDVNFLASGANNVRVGSAGSGIYSGKAGALVSIMPGLPTTKVLVAKVPKVPGQVTEIYPGPIYDKPSDHDSLVLIQDPSLAAHVTRPLVQGFQEFTLTDKDVSCTFRVRLNQRSNTPVQYRALVQDGTHSYARRDIGVAACLLVACKSDDASSCPYRFNKIEETVIESLEIEMNTYSNSYNETLDCENIEYFPLSMRYNKFPLSPTNYTFYMTTKDEPQEKCGSGESNVLSVFQNTILAKENKDSRSTIQYKIERPQSELVAFGIWGRLYTRDVDHNTRRKVTDEDVAKFNTILDRIYATDDV